MIDRVRSCIGDNCGATRRKWFCSLSSPFHFRSALFCRCMSSQSKFVRSVLALRGPQMASIVQAEEATLSQLWTSSEYRALPLKGRYIKLVEVVDAKIAATERQRFEAADAPRSECSAGCSSCCRSQHILLSHLEAQVLVSVIHQLPAEQRALVLSQIAAAEPTGDAKGTACAVLREDLCSAYEGRPMMCRTYLSTSVQRCLEFAAGSSKPPQVLGYPGFVGIAALSAANTDKQPRYEINTLLARMFGDVGLLEAWLSGNPSVIWDLAVKETRW